MCDVVDIFAYYYFKRKYFLKLNLQIPFKRQK